MHMICIENKVWFNSSSTRRNPIYGGNTSCTKYMLGTTQLCLKRPRGPGEHQGEREPAVCPCGTGGQWYSRQHGSIASTWRAVILPCTQHCSAVPISGLPITRETWTYWREYSEGLQTCLRVWSTWKGWEMWDCSAGGRLLGISSLYGNTCREGGKKMEPSSAQ